MAPLRVLVVGAGPAGSASAFWLAKLGHAVTVVERWPELRVGGLQVDLRGRGIEVMRLMGLEQPVRERCVREEGIAIVDAAGRQHAFFAANLSGKGPQTFSSEFEIMRGDLCRVLHDAAARRGARYRFGVTVDALAQRAGAADGEGAVEARLSDGAVERFDLALGCDGQGSRVRRLMVAAAGGTADGKDAKDGEDAKDSTLHLGAGRIAYFTMPRPIQEGERYTASFLKMPRGRSLLIRRHRADMVQVYMQANAGTGAGEVRDAPRRGDVAAEKAAFAEVFEGQGWMCDEAVRALREAADDFYCQYSGYVRVEPWSRGGIGLVGDAAHGSPPSGFGTSVALIGAYVLAGEIAQHRPVDDAAAAASAGGLEAALRAYEERMKPLVAPYLKNAESTAWNSLPSNAFTVGMLNRFLGLAAFLRVDKILGRLMPEGLANRWDMPAYEDMVKE